jgi:hypothetical protein
MIGTERKSVEFNMEKVNPWDGGFDSDMGV